LPGLGSLIGHKKKEGVWQIILFALGIPLTLVLIGFPMILAAWIWGIVTGVKLLDESEK
jgi:TM2 domain-containing membrane protein YozV